MLEGVENRELSRTVDGNVNWYSHYGETVWRFPNKLGIKISFDLAIPLLGICPEKNHSSETHMYPSVHCCAVCNNQI